MKITVPTKSLAARLRAVLPAVATRSGLPILSGVRLDASEDGLNVEATDLELTVRRAMHEVAVAAPGIVGAGGNQQGPLGSSGRRCQRDADRAQPVGVRRDDLDAGARLVEEQADGGEDRTGLVRRRAQRRPGEGIGRGMCLQSSDGRDLRDSRDGRPVLRGVPGQGHGPGAGSDVQARAAFVRRLELDVLASRRAASWASGNDGHESARPPTPFPVCSRQSARGRSYSPGASAPSAPPRRWPDRPSTP